MTTTLKIRNKRLYRDKLKKYSYRNISLNARHISSQYRNIIIKVYTIGLHIYLYKRISNGDVPFPEIPPLCAGTGVNSPSGWVGGTN